MPSDQDAVAIGGLIFAEARAALDLQRATVDSLRKSASTLIAAATGAISLLGVLQSGAATTSTWLGIGCFGGVVLLAALAHWPRSQFYAGFRPDAMVAAFLDREPRSALEDVYRDLALYLHRSFDLNERRATRLSACVRVSWALFFVDVVWWVVELMRGV